MQENQLWNPDEWPDVYLKPSECSVKGQRYVGFGEKMGEFTVNVRTDHVNGIDISSRVTSQGAKGRKHLLAVSGVIDKGNSVVFFDGSGTFLLGVVFDWSGPGHRAGVASVRKAVTWVQGRMSLRAKKWSLFCGLGDLKCEGCLVVRSGHGPQAEVAQGVGPGPLVEL